jgi:hypothetical protein
LLALKVDAQRSTVEMRGEIHSAFRCTQPSTARWRCAGCAPSAS